VSRRSEACALDAMRGVCPRRDATHCNTLRHTHRHLDTQHINLLQCVAVCCSVLQCVAVCCNVLQCVAV